MNYIRQFFGQIRNLIWRILFGDRIWAELRFFFLVGLIVAFFIFALRRWELNLVLQTASDIRDNYPGLSFLPQWVLLIIAPFFHLTTARFLLAPVGAVIFSLMIGALYVQDIYELKHYRNAFRYVVASMFGLFYPLLEIRDGKMRVELDEENLLCKIGGPGWVIIRPGNAVLFERLTNPTAVLSEGLHFIPRFEMIKQIVNLNDQHGYIEKISAVTKDGLVVNICDIHYVYRLYSGHRLGGESGRTQENPYPFSIGAVRNMAYGRSVTHVGVTPWERNLNILFEGEIQNYIRRRQLDQVTSPRTAGTDPRGDIHRLYQRADFRRRFKEVGAELVWYGIGHMEVDSSLVNEQRVNTWQAGWRGDVEVMAAYNDALKQIYKERGRAEAQAEILVAIIQALRDAGIQPGQADVKNVFLLRVAQLLESMNDNSAIG